jgi:lysophospholipase L1-like esterase
MTRRVRQLISCVALVLSTASTAAAQQPAPPDATRYLALGDSTAAGFKAQPATQGYPFLLYQGGVFDSLSRTVFNNLGTVGATSQDVALHQVPLALIPAARGGFSPQYVTLTVGGNDIAAIRAFAATNPGDLALALFIQDALNKYTANLGAIIGALAASGAEIFVGNQYTVPEIEALFPAGAQVLALFNQATALVVANAVSAGANVHLVDVFSAFEGRSGLLLIEKTTAGPLEVHLTNAGHRAMAQAFADVIDASQ